MTDPIATTTHGRVLGRRRAGDVEFLGILYAAPPFGPRRFGAPVPPERWDGVRDATRQAPTAPQPEQGFTIIPEPVVHGGEAPDCLVVNVFTPDPGAAGLPVMVWIHGGGFTSGTPSSPWYDGAGFTRDGIVVVSVGYRLGAEGFLHLPDRPANRGVLDWLAALTWVQDNIDAFGGDPAKVTVAGQSAGAGACVLLSTLASARGLFRGVIAMSGATVRLGDTARAFELTGAVAAALGRDPTAAALADVGVDALVTAQNARPSGDGRPRRGSPLDQLSFRPYVDGDVVAEQPIDVLSAGRTGHLPMVIGATRGEINALSAGVDPAKVVEGLTRLGLTEESARAYLGDGNGDPAASLGQANTDVAFRIPALRVAEARAADPAPTFHYDFAWQSSTAFGTVHCLDLPFAWDLLDAEKVGVVAGDAPPRRLADAVHGAWVDFVTGGDAGWSRFDATGRNSMVFDESSSVQSDVLGTVAARWP